MLGGNEMINKLARVFGLGLMIATFAFAGFAQTPQDEKTKLYNTYIEKYQSDKIEDLQVALDAAKKYVETYKDKPEDVEQVKYFGEAIPTLEKAIADKKGGDAAKAEATAWYAQLKKLVETANAKNWAETFTQGKAAIDKQFQYLDKPGGLTTEAVKGQKLDIAIGLGVIGFDRAFEKNDTFNNDALTYLNSAIKQLESGQTGTTTFGKALGYNLENKDNALGLMNYYVGYIMYFRQKKETDDSLGYFYKSTQYNSPAKSFPAVYEKIGLKYYNKLAELDPKRLAAIEAAPADQKDSPEIKAMLAEEKGVADRGIEAYAKAIKMADADAKISKEYKDLLRANLEQLYKFRYEKTDGVDAAISTAASKPLTNPTTPVTPVVEEVKPTDATTTTPATPATSTAPGATKPAATTTTPTTPTTKPAATTTTTTTATKPVAATTTTTTKTTTATKPAVKKPRKR